MRQGHLLPILILNIVWEVLPWTKSQKKSKDVRIGKETIIIHGQYDYVRNENPKESIDTLLELISISSCLLILEQYLVFVSLYLSSKKLENKILNNI